MFKAAALVSTLAVAAASNNSTSPLKDSDLKITCSACGGLDSWECPATATNGVAFEMKSSGNLVTGVNSESYYTVTVRAFGLTVQQTTKPACGIQSFDVLNGAGVVTTNLYDSCPKTGAFQSDAKLSLTTNSAGTYEADFRIYGEDNKLVGCLDVVMVSSK